MIEVGWIDKSGDENINGDFDNDTPLEAAFELVRKMNEGEGADMNFVLSGQLECPGKCSSCGDTLHHWFYADAEDNYVGRFECAHCDAWRTLTEVDES